MESNFNVQSATGEQAIFLCVKIKEANEKNVPLKHGEIIETICKVISNSQGDIMAGIVGYMYYNFKYVYIKSLWVNTAVRNRGYGTMLLESLESEAFKEGIKLIHVGTFEFNAKDFYIKRGYEVFYVLDEAALNNKSYNMKKILKSSDNFNIDYLVKNGGEHEIKYINDRVDEYNCSKVPFTNKEVFDYIDKVIKDEEGFIIAGIVATLSPWVDLIIEGIWVKDEYEDKGLKTKLLKEIERELKTKGGHLAIVETFDDKEKDFFASNGYEVCAILDEYPENYKAYYMKKLF